MVSHIHWFVPAVTCTMHCTKHSSSLRLILTFSHHVHLYNFEYFCPHTVLNCSSNRRIYLWDRQINSSIFGAYSQRRLTISNPTIQCQLKELWVWLLSRVFPLELLPLAWTFPIYNLDTNIRKGKHVYLKCNECKNLNAVKMLFFR